MTNSRRAWPGVMFWNNLLIFGKDAFESSNLLQKFANLLQPTHQCIRQRRVTSDEPVLPRLMGDEISHVYYKQIGKFIIM